MLHVRQPFFSLAVASFLSALALLHGMGLATGNAVVIAGFELSDSAGWAVVGVMFLLAYFALVHLKD